MNIWILIDMVDVNKKLMKCNLCGTRITANGIDINEMNIKWVISCPVCGNNRVLIEVKELLIESIVDVKLDVDKEVIEVKDQVNEDEPKINTSIFKRKGKKKL